MIIYSPQCYKRSQAIANRKRRKPSQGLSQGLRSLVATACHNKKGRKRSHDGQQKATSDRKRRRKKRRKPEQQEEVEAVETIGSKSSKTQASDVASVARRRRSDRKKAEEAVVSSDLRPIALSHKPPQLSLPFCRRLASLA